MKYLGFLILLCSLASLGQSLKVKTVKTPQGLYAQLSWTAPTTGCTAGCTYNILRGLTSGSEVQIASGVSALSYQDSTVALGQTYYYEVSATNSVATGPVSNEQSINIPVAPSAPVQQPIVIN